MWKLQENIIDRSNLDNLIDFIEKTDRFTQFIRVKEFEKTWSSWLGCKYSVFVNSGSSANLIMIDAVKEYYKIPDNSEVLVPAVTWVTNISPVEQVKLKPVFVDINLTDMAFDCDALEKSITNKTKIILITHLIGMPANMKRIQEIAKKHNLIILEDCCESHGAKFDGQKVGTFGVASTFSFYWGHHMTSIEGGTISTDNEELFELFLLKRSHGLARELPVEKHQKYKDMYPEIDFNFLFLTQGYNFRNTELHAVLGLEQIKSLDEYITIRNENHKKYLKIIEKIQDKIYHIDNPGISSFCLPFIFKNKEDKEKMMTACKKYQVEYRPIIGGNLLRQPAFKHYADYVDFPNAEIVHQNGFYIGNNQFVNDERLELLSKILEECF